MTHFRDGEGALSLNLRMYDASIGRWNGVDALSERYRASTSYSYTLNTPINAIDPDGRLVIFVNGNDNGEGASGYLPYWYRYPNDPNTNSIFPNRRGTRDYWKGSGFDTRVMDEFRDYNAIYRDGSFGSNRFTGSVGFSRAVSASFRYYDGYKQGNFDAEWILSLITDETGTINQSIKVISHSMGTAYAHGYVLALRHYLLAKGIDPREVLELIANFDPYQAAKIPADREIPTVQFRNTKQKGIDGEYRWLANQLQLGAYTQTNDNQSTHLLHGFLQNIEGLAAGNYTWNFDKKKWELIEEKE